MEKGVAIDSVLNAYESYLIESGYFSPNEEDRFSFYFKKMLEENDYIGAVPEPIFEAISKEQMGNHLNSSCFTDFDSNDIDIQDIIITYKFFELMEQLYEVEDTTTGPHVTATFFLRNFSEREMQSTFLRMQILIIIAWVTDLNKMTEFMDPLLPPIRG